MDCYQLRTMWSNGGCVRFHLTVRCMFSVKLEIFLRLVKLFSSTGLGPKDFIEIHAELCERTPQKMKRKEFSYIIWCHFSTKQENISKNICRKSSFAHKNVLRSIRGGQQKRGFRIRTKKPNFPFSRMNPQRLETPEKKINLFEKNTKNDCNVKEISFQF